MIFEASIAIRENQCPSVAKISVIHDAVRWGFAREKRVSNFRQTSSTLSKLSKNPVTIVGRASKLLRIPQTECLVSYSLPPRLCRY